MAHGCPSVITGVGHRVWTAGQYSQASGVAGSSPKALSSPWEKSEGGEGPAVTNAPLLPSFLTWEWDQPGAICRQCPPQRPQPRPSPMALWELQESPGQRGAQEEV